MKEVIKSKHNSLLKAWRKLLTPKGRKQAQTYLIEGDHLVEEAIKSRAEIQRIILSEDYRGQLDYANIAIPHSFLTSDLLRMITTTESPQGIVAEVAMYKDTPFNFNGSRYILLDHIQDPGNVGTIIRTAAAANYDGVILGSGTVDLYNDKVIRSTQGSLWHIPIIEMPLENAIDKLKTNRVSICVSALNAKAQSYKTLDAKDSMAFIVGNEGQGVSQEIINQADEMIYIEMPGPVESLNVAIASGILMFHYLNH